jgi:hypothetical protein
MACTTLEQELGQKTTRLENLRTRIVALDAKIKTDKAKVSDLTTANNQVKQEAAAGIETAVQAIKAADESISQLNQQLSDVNKKKEGWLSTIETRKRKELARSASAEKEIDAVNNTVIDYTKNYSDTYGLYTNTDKEITVIRENIQRCKEAAEAVEAAARAAKAAEQKRLNDERQLNAQRKRNAEVLEQKRRNAEVLEQKRRNAEVAKAAANAKEEADGLANDPCKVTDPWKKAWNKEYKRVYYYNTTTNKTQYECPCDPAKGWTQAFDDSGRVYYHSTDGQTSWECPTTPVAEPAPVATPVAEPTPAEPAQLTFSSSEVSEGTDIQVLNSTLPALKAYVASLTGKYYGGVSTGLKAGNLKTKLPDGWSSFIVTSKRIGVKEKPVVTINGMTYTIKGQHATLYVYNDDIKTITDGVNQKAKDILEVQQGGRRKRTRKAKRKGGKTRSRR